MQINNVLIGENTPCYIIAEISANHNQSIDRAFQIILAAKNAGANAVKLQTYTPDTLTINSSNTFFQITEGSWKGKNLYELYSSAFTPWEWHPKLKEYADSLKIDLFSTPFDKSAVDFLETLNLPAYKIASFEIVDLELIHYVASKKKPIILSTGMSTLGEVEDAVKIIRKAGNGEFALLKCTSDYPAIPEEMNLASIDLLRNTFNCIAGLSDHSLFSEIAIAAVARGASIIEKHLTLDRNEEGPDSKFSMEPQEFKEMVSAIRIVEKAIGKPELVRSTGEEKNIVFRRSLFVTKDIKENELFTKENIRSIRPGYGLPPKLLPEILGSRASRNLQAGTPLSLNCVQFLPCSPVN